jgi:hypothetical protein
MLGMSDVRDLMEERGITVHGFEMGIVILLQPHRIDHGGIVIPKEEEENILRMGITDGKAEGRLLVQAVEDNGIPILSIGDDGQGILESQFFPGLVADDILHRDGTLQRTVDRGTGYRE